MAVPNEGTGNLPSDQGGRFFVGGWDGAAFQAFRVDTNKNQKAVIYGPDGNPLLPAAAAIGDTAVNPTTTSIASRSTGWNGAAWERLKSGGGQLQTRLSDSAGVGIATAADGDAQATATLLGASARQQAFNGSTWDRLRNSQKQTLLASAARTATTSTAVYPAYNYRGVILLLYPTAVSGTGGLQLEVCADTGERVLLASSNITTVNSYVYIVYPGAGTSSGNPSQSSPVPLPASWYVQVNVVDASSYTYSLIAHLIP